MISIGAVVWLMLSAWAGVVSVKEVDVREAYAPRRVAVVIGVEAYEDPTLEGLRFPAKDARDIGAVLNDPAVGGFDRVFVIEGNASTTRRAIRRALDVAAADLQRDDTFFLYLSGHGTLTLDAALGSRLWFLPSDGRLDDPERTGLALTEIERWLSDLTARRRVLVMDTCHNGRTAGPLAGRSVLNGQTTQLLAGLKGEAPVPRGLREVSESEARLFAAQYHQPAMEDPALENGVYTHYLIQSLTSERHSSDLDGDGLVDVAEAHAYARDKTITHTGGIQVPRAEYRIVGREEIWLAGDPGRRTRAEHALLSGVDDVLASARVLIDGIPRGGAVGLTALAPGRHHVELQSEDGRRLAGQTVRVHAGATVALEDVLEADRSRWFVLAGGGVVSGPQAESWAPVVGELEVGWLGRRTAAGRAELHARNSVGTGTFSDVGAAGSSGLAALGGGVLWGVPRLSVGPSMELGVPWRSIDVGDAVVGQGALTVVPAVRGLMSWRAADRAWFVRADARWVPMLYDTERSGVWHHGVAVGFGAR